MDLTVTKRETQSKGERNKRRRQGFVPGAVYGRGLEPFLVEIPAKGIADALTAETGLNTIINLKISGDRHKHTVMIDNLERDPITRDFLHVGLHQVKKGEKVNAQIPIQLVGEPRDVAFNGALLEQTLNAIDVTADPTDLPPHLDVDVSKMKLGDVLHVSDLPHNAKLTFSTGEDVVIASLHASTTAQEVEADEAAAEEAAAEEAQPSDEAAVTELAADSDRDSDSVTGAAS